MAFYRFVIPETQSGLPEREAYFQSLYKIRGDGNQFTETVLRGIGDDCIVSNKISQDGSLQKVCVKYPNGSSSLDWKKLGTYALAALAGGLVVYLVIKK